MTEFIPSTEKEGINSTDENPIFELAWLVLGTVVILAFLYASLGFVGEKFIVNLTPEKEIEYFSKIPVSKQFNVESNARFDEINELFKHLEDSSLKNLKLLALKDKELNAFAYPGGMILVTEGLLEKVKSKMGLAFVVGHEIGHFQNRDHLRGMGKALGFTMISSLLGFAGSDFVLSSITQEMVANAYNRTQEDEADEFAMKLLKLTYGTSQGAEEFFRVILSEQGQFSKYIPGILSTHPHPKERLEKILKFKR